MFSYKIYFNISNLRVKMDNTKKYCDIASFLIMAFAIIIVLEFKLVGATITGFLVYSISQTISNKLDSRFQLGKIARTIAIALLILIVSIAVWGLIISIYISLKDQVLMVYLLLF